MPGLGTEARINLLNCSGLKHKLPVPTDNEVLKAYVIWLYSYISFVRFTKCEFCGTPLLPVSCFKFENMINDDLTYLLNDKTLIHSDLIFNSLYPSLLPKIQKILLFSTRRRMASFLMNIKTFNLFLF